MTFSHTYQNKKKVIQGKVLESHSGDSVAALNWGEGGSESISVRKGHLSGAQMTRNWRRKVWSGVFWTETTASKNILKVGWQI